MYDKFKNAFTEKKLELSAPNSLLKISSWLPNQWKTWLSLSYFLMLLFPTPLLANPWDSLPIAGTPDSGHVTLDSAVGSITIPYRIENGRAIYGGDVDLGPVSDSGELLHPRGANPSGTAWKWPNGDVPYTFEPGCTQACQQIIVKALQYISQNTAVKFHARKPEEVDYVHFIPTSYASSEFVGRKGGMQKLNVPLFAPDSIVHEVGHALGLYHEHQRANRDEYVTHHPECVAEGQKQNFDLHLGTVDLEPYDYGSAMHYEAFDYSCDDCGGWCPTLANAEDTGPVQLTPLPEGEYLSEHDKNSLIRMYPFIGSADEKGDQYGAVLATGDFDGDGYDDLAVGAPGENINAIADGGLVRIEKGVHSPILRSRSEIWPPSYTGGERFGAALTAGDFNGDGYDDLAIAAPGRDVDGHVDWGSLYIAYGSRRGLGGIAKTLTPTSLPVPADCPKEIGKTLNHGDFNKDGIDDLIFGCAGSRAFILFGQANNNFAHWRTLKLEEYLPNADLAPSQLKSIAVSPVYQSEYSRVFDLALGYDAKDKNETKKRGMVVRMSLNDNGNFFSLTQHDILKGSYPENGFGSSLAYLNKGDLAVGIPKADIVWNGKTSADAGMVQIYNKSDLFNPPLLKKTYISEDFGVASSPGDQFGSALVAYSGFNSNAGDWLAISSPWEDTNFDLTCEIDCPPGELCGCNGGFAHGDAGIVYLSQPNATSLMPNWKFNLMQAVVQTDDKTTFNGTNYLTVISKAQDPAGTSLSPMDEEYFGTALAVRYGPEGRPHLLVGAPGNSNNHGGRLIEYDMDMRFGKQTSYINVYRYRQRTAWKPSDPDQK